MADSVAEITISLEMPEGTLTNERGDSICTALECFDLTQVVANYLLEQARLDGVNLYGLTVRQSDAANSFQHTITEPQPQTPTATPGVPLWTTASAPSLNGCSASSASA